MTSDYQINMAKSKSLTRAEEAKIAEIKLEISSKISAAGVNGITLNQAVEIFKDSIDQSIIAAGAKGKESLICSQVPIKIFHEVIKQELIRNGVRPDLIFPPLGSSSNEIKLHGYFKDKHQDVCVLPNDAARIPTQLTTGLLRGQTDALGTTLTERTIAINVRSQMSSIGKNIDTMYERIFAEPLNLHMRCANIVMGEFYIIPTTGYDSDQLKNNNPVLHPKVFVKRNAKSKTTAEVIEEYIFAFQSVNNRAVATNEHYKYERACLLIVDFSANPFKLYQNNQELINDSLLPINSVANLDELSFNSFISDLLQIYSARFGTGKFI